MNFNNNDLTKMDSSVSNLLQIEPSWRMKGSDFLGLGISFSLGKRQSLFDLTKQATNKSNESVGGFKIARELSFNPNGDLMYSFTSEKGRTHQLNDDIDGAELDNVMIRNNINITQSRLTYDNTDRADQFELDISMTNSKDLVDIMGSSFGNKQHYPNINRSITNKRSCPFDEYILIDSSSRRKQLNNINNNLNSVNLSAYLSSQQNNNMMFQDNSMNFSINLISQKLEIKSEPDYDVKYKQDFIFEEEIQKQKGNFCYENIDNQIDNGFSDSVQRQQANTESIQICGNNDNFQSPVPGLESNENVKLPEMAIEPFQFIENNHVEMIYPHSDNEENNSNNRKRKTISIPKGPANDNDNQNQKSNKRTSNYRQSRHKNVFKNFGGTLLRFIIYNQHFQDRVIVELDNDAVKKAAFQDWLQNDIKLERKRDFQIAWTTFKTDTEDVKEFKQLLRELSKDFFENFAFIYLINSKKISDFEIHLRSIHTYMASISNPELLNRFKPV